MLLPFLVLGSESFYHDNLLILAWDRLSDKLDCYCWGKLMGSWRAIIAFEGNLSHKQNWSLIFEEELDEQMILHLYIV